jgi:hypothetical protein
VRRIVRGRADDLPRLLRGREIALVIAVAAVAWIPTAVAVHLLAGRGYASGLGAYAFAIVEVVHALSRLASRRPMRTA